MTCVSGPPFPPLCDGDRNSEIAARIQRDKRTKAHPGSVSLRSLCRITAGAGGPGGAKCVLEAHLGGVERTCPWNWEAKIFNIRCPTKVSCGLRGAGPGAGPFREAESRGGAGAGPGRARLHRPLRAGRASGWSKRSAELDARRRLQSPAQGAPGQRLRLPVATWLPRWAPGPRVCFRELRGACSAPLQEPGGVGRRGGQHESCQVQGLFL